MPACAVLFFFLALGSEIYLSLQLLAIFGKPSHYLLKYCSFLILSSLPSHYLSCFLDIMSGPWQRELAPSPAMSGYWVAYFSCGLWDYLLCRYLGTHDCLFFFFCWDLDLNSGLHLCKAGTLLLKPHLQSILLWLFLEMGSLEKYLPQLALNPDLPDLNFPRS
jgi:hypothetical protein